MIIKTIKMSETTSQTTEASHESTLYAEPIFHVGNFTITNSLLTSWVAVVILIVFFIALGKKIKKVPRGIQNIFEIILEEALSLADSITGNRKKSEKFLPIALTLFLFILINNWLGLIPGVGTIGFIEGETHKIFVPLLRGGTADLNTTLALALFAVVASHVMGVITIGLWKHFNKFINLKAFIEIPKKISSDVSIALINPIKAFVGIIEIIGEIAKVASLSFRLFGNIFAGEVLLASTMALFAFILPLPFMFLEIIVGLIQSLIFAMLTLVFMTIASQSEEH
ncbi:MAG: ATP synthase F0 subunit A [Candidatus Portnoybacteria bacterium CG10_big_fil_rev_8_21_14_0_10_36_7]|uniref:ATP synthase subunit a n=1 Tax=Candidatus Portnoybacteria bacterium CG10_big_fil_rev_8_21_14_0_10_36_7 TaxID=1974812 RepID=A0A2M8KE71_9BACT|nr:MAG: ATP synthase F0 subunit A [Candidatus Portnoybacteria bacterium CG10_big_fil_rev_8_21_14_0_10_36_7]